MRAVRLLVLLLVSMEITRTLTYRTGATVHQCNDMLPGHQGNVHHVDNDDDNKSYGISTSYFAYTAGANVVVYIVAPWADKPGRSERKTIKGFMAQGRDDSGAPVGQFSLELSDANGMLMLACGGQNATAVTHSKQFVQRSIIALSWYAPPDIDEQSIGNVTFFATVVEEYTEVYVDLRSRPMMPVASAKKPDAEWFNNSGSNVDRVGTSTSRTSHEDSDGRSRAPPAAQRDNGLSSSYWSAAHALRCCGFETLKYTPFVHSFSRSR